MTCAINLRRRVKCVAVASGTCCSQHIILMWPQRPSSLSFWEGFKRLGQSQADKFTGWDVISYKRASIDPQILSAAQQIKDGRNCISLMCPEES